MQINDAGSMNELPTRGRMRVIDRSRGSYDSCGRLPLRHHAEGCADVAFAPFFCSGTDTQSRKVHKALAIGASMDRDLEVDGELHGDAALDEAVRMRVFPDLRLKGEPNERLMSGLRRAPEKRA